ncbi:phospholipase D-like domain-containing protein [Nocardioides litoris]|uniref:phospholipase D-like domain-containing protein n=1 Tax=Nocardioides litoris TaxID=1926648 RepID=UPI001120B7F9|nr:phospholipase D-like domain-containing protein [Nocardioides litoris]
MVVATVSLGLVATVAPPTVAAAPTRSLTAAAAVAEGATPLTTARLDGLAQPRAAVNGKKRRWAGWKPREGASFNIPRSSAANEYRNEARIIEAINHARKNSTIKMAMFSFDRKPVSDALIRAYRKRNVTVQVIVNGHEKPGAQVDLQRALGARYKKKPKPKNPARRNSFFYQCVSSCRGHFDVQHSKFVLFTQTGAAKNVTMVGSLNMKANGAVNQFNDLLVLNKAPGLYGSLDKTFQQMKQDKVLRNPLKHEVFGRYELWTMPFARQKGATPKTEWRIGRDPIIKLLNRIKCTGARTDSGRTIVRVNMHAWDGERGLALAKRFRQLYADGCDVKLMVGFAGRQAREVFGQRTKRGFVPMRSTGYDTDGDLEIDLYSHTKILTVNGNMAGKRDRKLVVTGSSNYQNGGQYGDELVLAINSANLYRQYADNWGYVYKNHTHGFSFNGGASRVTPDGRTVVVKPYLYDGLGIDSEEWRDQ